MQGYSKAGYIAILVDFPPRPWKFLPGSRINKEFHIIGQGLYNSKVPDNAELVLNPLLFYLLIVVAKTTYEIVDHIWQLYILGNCNVLFDYIVIIPSVHVISHPVGRFQL